VKKQKEKESKDGKPKGRRESNIHKREQRESEENVFQVFH